MTAGKRIYLDGMTTSEFKTLISLAQAGDASALSELLAGFRNYLRLLARLHVKPLLQAKFDESDIVQETCVQAALAIHQFTGDDEAQFAGWLRQILANKGAWMARQYVGTHQRDVMLERQLQDQFDRSSADLAKIIPSQIDSPTQQFLRKERALILADAIARVTADQRDVLMMHGLEAMPIPDVAKRIGRSESATWKIWARGLQALRRTLQETE